MPSLFAVCETLTSGSAPRQRDGTASHSDARQEGAAMTDEPIPYREESPDHWAEAVAREWDSVEEEDGTVRLSGTCPTCDHRSETVFSELASALAVDRTRIPIIVVC